MFEDAPHLNLSRIRSVEDLEITLPPRFVPNRDEFEALGFKFERIVDPDFLGFELLKKIPENWTIEFVGFGIVFRDNNGIEMAEMQIDIDSFKNYDGSMIDRSYIRLSTHGAPHYIPSNY